MKRVIVSLALVALLLALGAGAMTALRGMKKPPPREEHKEGGLPVEVMKVKAADIPVFLSGWGTLRSRSRLSVIPEVGGRVVAVHPRLEDGESLQAGELLLRIDPAPYRLRVEQTKAEQDRLKTTIERIRKTWAADRERLAILEKSLALAEKEYKRTRELFEEGGVGSQAAVDGAESAVLSARERLVGLRSLLDSYPLQIRELEASLAAASAGLESARIDLGKTELRAPFAGRVESAAVEKGQVVSPGREVLRLVDDTVLELPVTLDGRDLARWIPFAEEPEGRWWFGRPASGPAEVVWVEDPDRRPFTGKASRVEKYDPRTRTAVLVLVVERPAAGTPGPQLVEGMFCRARIPGRSAPGVFRIPRSGIEPDGTVYLAREERLARSRVTVLHEEEDHVLVSSGLAEGDLLVLTRLVSPVVGTPLRLTGAAPASEE
jgi:RND family efflux transporter MFP subunit